MRLVEEGKLIHILRESITSMSGTSLQLSNHETIQSDAVVFATGWIPSHSPLFDQDTAASLGLPIPLDQEAPAEASYWKKLESAADKIVLRLYPKLKDPPFPPRPSVTSPWRLFRTMAPTSLAAAHDYSLVFVGLISNNQVSTHAEISGLWAVAYLEGQLSGDAANMLNSKQEMDMDVATMTTFMARRYLGRKEVPDAAMEIQDYTDLMMRDLGLRTDRKRLKMSKTWFGYQAWKAEWFDPYMPKDYKGVVQEFLHRIEKSTKE